MIIFEPRKELPGERWHKGHVSDEFQKQTRKGLKNLLTCRDTTPGIDEGREANFLIPPLITTDTYFYAFIVSIVGHQKVGEDFDDFGQLVGKKCAFKVKHVRFKSRMYANVIALAPYRKKIEEVRRIPLGREDDE